MRWSCCNTITGWNVDFLATLDKCLTSYLKRRCSHRYISFTSPPRGAARSKPWNGGLGFARSCDDVVVLERFSLCACEQGQSTKRCCCSSSRICIHGSGCHSFRQIPRHSVSTAKWICRNSLIVFVGVDQALGSDDGCFRVTSTCRNRKLTPPYWRSVSHRPGPHSVPSRRTTIILS